MKKEKAHLSISDNGNESDCGSKAHDRKIIDWTSWTSIFCLEGSWISKL
jgi:hypothetical protein